MNNWFDLIGPIIFIIIVIGGWIAKASKGNESTTRKGSDNAEEAQARRQRLEQLANRRREELRELAAKRKQQQGVAQQTQAKARPDNLSVAEAERRERARQAYEQRAEELRRKRAEIEHEKKFRQQQTQEARAEARAQQARSRSNQPRQSQAQARTGGRSSSASTGRQSSPSRTSASPVQTGRTRSAAGRPTAVTPISQKASIQDIRDISSAGSVYHSSEEQEKAAAPVTTHQLLTGRNLKEAFLLREIFDKPRALRDEIFKPL